MIELETPRFAIGDTVLVLCRYDHYDTPSLLKTTVEAVAFNSEGRVSYRFAGWHEKDNVVKVFALEDEAEAQAEICAAVERHKQRKPELD